VFPGLNYYHLHLRPLLLLPDSMSLLSPAPIKDTNRTKAQQDFKKALENHLEFYADSRLSPLTQHKENALRSGVLKSLIALPRIQTDRPGDFLQPQLTKSNQWVVYRVKVHSGRRARGEREDGEEIRV